MTPEEKLTPWQDKVEYCGWREFIMWIGVGGMVICGLLVGRDYFNRTIESIHQPKESVE